MMQHSDAGLGDLAGRLVEHVPHQRHFRIHRCIATVVPPSWGWTEPRFIDDYHLLYLHGGRGAYGVGGHCAEFTPGLVILAGSGVRHTARQDPADPPDLVSVRFGLYEGERPLILAHSARLQSFAPAEDGRAVLFSRLVGAHAAGREGECASLLHVILCGLCSAVAVGTEAGVDPRIEAVRAQLDLHPVRRLDVGAMAAMAGLSRNYFVRLFTAQVGMPPKAYQVGARMRFARYLLEHTDAGVKRVAADLRFPDPYAFSKQFRKYHGHPPSRYLRSRASAG